MISVLMVAYNHGPFLARSIASVIGQGRGDWELVIVDDGSTDASPQVFAGFRDPRIRVISRGHRGLLESYREGIAACAGEFIAFLEGDDAWHAGNLSAKIAAFERWPEAGLVYSGVEIEGDDRVVRRKGGYLRSVSALPAGRPFDASMFCAYMNPVPTFSAVMCRRGLLNGIKYPGNDLAPWLDWSFWNQISLKAPFVFLPEKLVTWRHHDNSFYRSMERRRFLQTKAKEVGLRFVFLARSWKAEGGFLRKIGRSVRFVGGICSMPFKYIKI